MTKIQYIFFFFIFFYTIWAQESPENILPKENPFENYFYDALTQKGIENYDKSIDFLQKCLSLEAQNPVVYHELGKNYLSLKKYAEAEENFTKATELNPNERWYWNGLYDVYYQTKNYQKSISIVQKLIGFSRNFEDDLVSLYMYTNQHEKALELLNQMEQTTNLSKQMELYKLQLTRNQNNSNNQVGYLEKQLQKNPKDENAYIQLIFYYSENKQEEKAFEIAQQLHENIPTSEWAHVSLFKFYLSHEKNTDKAIEAMNQVMISTKIDAKIKHRIINEFLIFTTQNLSYIPALNEAIEAFEKTDNLMISNEIGKYFYTKNNFLVAEKYFEKAIQKNPNEIETIDLYLQTLLNQQKFELLTQKATAFLDFFPTDANLYYYQGVGFYKTQKTEKSIATLENGLDFVIENQMLEQKYYQLLVEIAQSTSNISLEKKYKEKQPNAK